MSLQQKGQADVCKLRFSSSGYTRLYAWSQRRNPESIFDSRGFILFHENG